MNRVDENDLPEDYRKGFNTGWKEALRRIREFLKQEDEENE